MMGFWVRRILLILLVAVAPVAAALWVDGKTAIERAQTSGAQAVRRAAQALSDRAALVVRGHLDEALAAAHDLEDLEVLERVVPSGRGRRSAEAREAALDSARARLANARPEAGFAWLVDARGRVVAVAGAGAPGRDVSGHPLFRRSQQGVAGDRLWRDGAPMVWGASAPLVVQGQARGAVIVGWPVDQAFVDDLASTLDVELTLIRDDRVVHSSLSDRDIAGSLGPAFRASEPVTSGALETPLSSPVPGLPLLVGSRAEGLAYSSRSVAVPGSPYRWVVSVPSIEAFESLASRQVDLLGAGLALVMVILLFSVIDERTLIAPIHRISEHLSEIQLGRGEAELPEIRVSKPFRRLVRLINMTVQKLPSRGLATLSGTTIPPMSTASGPMPERVSSAPQPAAGAATEPPSQDDIAQAIAALGGTEPPATTPQGPRSPPAPRSPARSAASISAVPNASTQTGASPRRSASTIRGGTPAPGSGDRIEEDFYEVSQFTMAPNVRRTATSVRGGGSFDLSQAAGLSEGSSKPEGADSTVVAPVEKELLAQSARRDLTGQVAAHDNQDMTVVATVDPKLLSESAEDESDREAKLRGNLDDDDWNHFKSVYEEFIDLRRKCGERISDLGFERFLGKLKRNRAKLVEKYNCKTVRFQVYEKDGKAALKATPVRAR